MDIRDLDCVVIGAGIGGLAVAAALAGQGARRVRVLEQAPALREVGAGLQVSPNGFVVLEALGLGAALRARAVRVARVRLRDYSGRDVLRLDLGGLTRAEYHFVHRADLLEVLAAGAARAGVELVTGSRVTGLRPGARPSVSTGDGREIDADLVVAADGLNSVARPMLNGAGAPFFTGQVAWRAVIPDTDAAPEAQVFMGPRRHLVTYPLTGNRRNLVAVQERAGWQDQSWSHEDDPANLRDAFADFGAEARDMLAQVDKVHLWGLFRHPVATHWHQGGVALLGDAAHPTLPFLAQGANLALEDAWGLLRSLQGADTLADGLTAYQDLRRDRAARIVAAASGNAWKYHLSFPPLRLAAHTALRVMGRVAPGRMTGQFDWLYGYDITRD